MAYCVPGFKTKKALKEAIMAGSKVEVIQQTPWGIEMIKDGSAVLEMPPEYHKWYAQVNVRDGFIVSVK